MKLKEAKNRQNVFRSNLNEISRGRHKSEEQKSTLENINCFANHGKLLLNYLMIVLPLYLSYIQNNSWKAISSMSAHATRSKVPDYCNLKILSPKQILQRLSIALAQVKTGIVHPKTY